MAVFRGLFVRKDATRGTQPAEARKALAGLLVPSSVVGARQGILAAPGDPLRVSGTAGWTYQVNGGHLVSSRGDTDGAVLFGNDGTTQTPAVAAAPGSGSRWDLIYLRHEDVDKGGGETSAATLGVVEGVASGSPVRPATPAGAVVLAEALVSAGATSTQHANVTITNLLPLTVARGGIVPVTNQAQRDALAVFEGLYADRADVDILERHTGAAWVPIAGKTAEAAVSLENVGLDSGVVEAMAPTITSQTGGFGVSGFDVTVPVAGLYAVSVTADVSANAVTRAFLNVVVAGAVNRIPGAAEDILSGAVVARLAAGGAVKVEAFQNSGAIQSATGSLLIARLTP